MVAAQGLDSLVTAALLALDADEAIRGESRRV